MAVVSDCVCGHPVGEHGRECDFFYDTDSRRELCLLCREYEYETGEIAYPNGKAWHRFKAEEVGNGSS